MPEPLSFQLLQDRAAQRDRLAREMTHQPFTDPYGGVPENFALGVYEMPGLMADALQTMAGMTPAGLALNNAPDLKAPVDELMNLAEIQGAYDTLSPDFTASENLQNLAQFAGQMVDPSMAIPGRLLPGMMGRFAGEAMTPVGPMAAQKGSLGMKAFEAGDTEWIKAIEKARADYPGMPGVSAQMSALGAKQQGLNPEQWLKSLEGIDTSIYSIGGKDKDISVDPSIDLSVLPENYTVDDLMNLYYPHKGDMPTEQIHPEEFLSMPFYHGNPKQLDAPLDLRPGSLKEGRGSIFASTSPALGEQFMAYSPPKDPNSLLGKALLSGSDAKALEGSGGGHMYRLQVAPGKMFGIDALDSKQADNLNEWILNNKERFNDFADTIDDGASSIGGDYSTEHIWDAMKKHDWRVIENPVIQDWIRNHGFDSFGVRESELGPQNIGVFNPNRVRSDIRARRGDPIRYDVEDLKVTPNIPQVMMERYNAPKGKPSTLKGMLGKRAADRLTRYAEAGADQGLGWYNLDPLRRQFIAELGPVEGEKQFGRYTDFLAATSPREKVKQNVKRASLFHTMERQGEPFGHLMNPGKGSGPGTEIPAGYGSLGHNTQMHLLRDLEGGGHFSSLDRPKTSSFAQNLAGNQLPMTIDTHNIKALTGGKWDRSPSKGEYKYIESFQQELADKIGMSPAQFQSSVWVGAGGDTGVADVRPFIDVFNDVVVETAKKRGETPMESLRQFIRGEKPLLGLAALLSSGTIMQMDGGATGGNDVQ